MARSEPVSPAHPTARIVGNAPVIHALRAQILHLVTFDTIGSAFAPTLLLQGETGTGKGLVARVIHDSGPRAQGPFVDVNCAAIPETLLEAELFGFEAGTFTDAKRAKPGLIESAVHGTLFLDEIDALPLLLQSKLLSAIDEKRVRRLGAVASRQLDVKFIAATPTELSQRVAEGHFRSDLYHRLAMVLLEIPPLRERGADILVLAQHFLRQYAVAHGLPPKQLRRDAEVWLQGYDWSGNVRELSHLMERVTLLNLEALVAAPTLEQLCLPRAFLAVRVETPPVRDESAPLDTPARIRQALRQTGGNVVRAAQLLGISRGTLRYWMRRHDIERPNSQALTPLHGSRAQDAIGSCAAERSHPTGMEGVVLTSAWEQKPVAVLAIDMTWPDAMDQHSQRTEPWTVMTRWQQTIVEKLQGFGGVIAQSTPSPITAIFGIPQTLEQMPQRAVQAALTIRRQLTEARAADGRQLCPEVRMAGHLGQVLVDVQASNPTARLLPLGETLSLPVRLLGHAAPGDILLSPAVGRLVEGWFELHGREGSAGVSMPDGVGAYAVVGLGPRCSPLEVYGKRPLSRFVGRERELTTLRDILAHVEQGHGQIVSIVGEPGVGKSRLCYELTQAQRPHGWLLLESSPVAYGKESPYLPVIELLKAYFQLDTRDELQTIHEKVVRKLRTLGEGLGPTLPALLALLDLPVEDPQWQALEPPQRRQRTLEACTCLLLRESQDQPILLIVENLHWIDTETQAFLDDLVDSLPSARIVLLVTYRPDYHHGWGSKTYYTQLRLDPLPPARAEELLHQLLGDHPTLESLIQLLIARTEGNPFFLEESVRTLVETRVLVGAQGAYSLAQALPTIQVPATVQAVLAARIDRLPPEAKYLLQTAAVIGSEVQLSLLQGIAELPETALHESLRHLQAAEFLYETHLFPEYAYTFKHALTHEVAYGSLAQERRRALHARIVEVLETLAGERLVDYVERLAVHAVRGEVWDKAFLYCRQAGNKALARSAYREALGYFEQALSALSHLPETRATREQAIDLRLALRTALFPSGDYGRILAYLHEAEALAAALDDPQRLGQVSVCLALHFRNRSMYDQAIAAGQRALALATTSKDSVLHALAYQYLGVTYEDQGDYQRAIACLGETVAAFDGARRHERGGQLLLPAVFSRTHLATCHAERGTFAEGRGFGDEGLRIAEAVAHPGSLMYASHGIGMLSLRQGDLPQALSRLERALGICQDMAPGVHRPANFPRIAADLAAAYTLGGRVTDAVLLLTRAIDAQSMPTGGAAGILCRLSLGEAQVLAGRLEEAHALAKRVLALAGERQQRGCQAYALRLLGEIAARREPPERDRAVEDYCQALALAEELGMRPLVAHCHAGLGTLYAQTGHREQARTELATAIAMYRAMEMPFWLPRTEAALAQVL